MNTHTAHPVRLIAVWLFLSVAVLPAPAHAQGRGAELAHRSDRVFPEPPQLRPAVDFWRQVFGVWRRDQVALHDDRHLGVIYELITVPGEVTDALTRAQQAYVQARREALERELTRLERGIRQRTRLTRDQQRLLDLIDRKASRAALFGASTRVRAQRGIRERFHGGAVISGRYDRLFRQIFREMRLPEDLALLPHIESSFINHARSSAGAVGMWQFMPATGRRYLRMGSAIDERYDPVLAARGAARYLRDARAQLGDWGLAITSYNHGVGGMARAKREHGPHIERIVEHYRGRTFGFSSRNFYAEFLAARSLVKKLPFYFPEGVRFEPPLEHQRVILKQPMPVTRLASLVAASRQELIQMNPAWTSSATRGRVSLPAGAEVWLPSRGPRLSTQLAAYPQPTAPTGGAPSRQLVAGAVSPASAIQTRTVVGGRPARAEGAVTRGSLDAAEPRPRPSGARARVGPATTEVTPRRPAQRTHVVRKGESPYRVAVRYGVPVNALLAFNELHHGAVIRPGQRLRIPAAESSKK